MRITCKVLENLCERINRATGRPLAAYTKTERPPYPRNPGHIYVQSYRPGYVRIYSVMEMTADGESRWAGGMTARECFRYLDGVLEAHYRLDPSA